MRATWEHIRRMMRARWIGTEPDDPETGIGVVVGLRAEAALLRGAPFLVVAGGGTAAGAVEAAAALALRLGDSLRGLISFGLAGGLDPDLRPGVLLRPSTVLAGGDRFAADPAFAARFGGLDGSVMLGDGVVLADAAAKRRLFAETGACAVDLESGAVARAAARLGVPFLAVRAVCDPAGRALPPAALAALDARGRIAPWAMLASLAGEPGQIPGLLRLAGDARRARGSLRDFARGLGGAGEAGEIQV